MPLASAVDTWATVAVAIGTIGAVAYALFRDLIVTPRRRPKLELRFDGTTLNDQVITMTAAGREAACVRVRVVNRPGRDSADDVVVMVTGLERLDGADGSVARPVSLPLIWSGSNPPFTVASVHPGSERHVDLLHVDLDEPAPPRLDVSPKPAGDEDNLEPGKYLVSVEIRARNADASRYEIPVSWDGHTTERAAVWDHLGVEPPRRVR